MKIDELIEQLDYIAEYEVGMDYCKTVHKAAETIRLLWEVVRDSTNEKYKMQIDEWSGNNDTQNAD